jgi:hypothetical protein
MSLEQGYLRRHGRPTAICNHPAAPRPSARSPLRSGAPCTEAPRAPALGEHEPWSPHARQPSLASMRFSPARSFALRALGSATLMLLACATASCGGGGGGGGGAGGTGGAGGAGAGGAATTCTSAAGEACTASDQCCTSHCSAGALGEIPAGTCCAEEGAQCQSSGDCCTGGGCENGICGAALVTIPDGYVCGSDLDCLSGNCSAEGVCAPPP